MLALVAEFWQIFFDKERCIFEYYECFRLDVLEKRACTTGVFAAERSEKGYCCVLS